MTSPPIPSSPFPLIQPTFLKLNLVSRDLLRTPAFASHCTLANMYLVPQLRQTTNRPSNSQRASEKFIIAEQTNPSPKKTPTNQPLTRNHFLLPQQSNLSIDFFDFFFLLLSLSLSFSSELSRPTCSALPSSAHPPRPSAPLLPDPPPSEERP